MNRPILLGAAALALVSLPLTAGAQTTPAYHVVKTVALGAPDTWDYVVFDDPAHRVYVAHGDRLTVVDGRDGTVIGNVEGMPGGSHGTGTSTANGRGYTNDGKTGAAWFFG